MFTKTENIQGNDYVITAFISANGQRGLTQINFSAVDGDFRINKSFYVRDIQTKAETFNDFKAIIRKSRKEYENTIKFIENRGFNPVVNEALSE